MIVPTCYFEITSSCNLNCIHCYNRNTSNNPKQLEFNAIMKAIRHFSHFGLKTIGLSGGEALLYPNISSLIESILEERFNVILLTNGSLLVKHYLLSDLIQHLHFLISYDGVSENTLITIRGKDIKNTIENNIKDIVQAGSNNITLKMTLNRYNINEIVPFFKYCTKHDITPAFGVVIRQGNAKSHWSNLGLDLNDYLSAIQQINDCYKTYNMPFHMMPASFGCPIGDETQPYNLLVRSDGHIQPCQLLYQDDFSIGNIYRSNMIDAAKLQSLQAIAKEKALRDVNNCSKCMIQGICKRGCLADAYYDNGSILASDNYCQTRRAIAKDIVFKGDGTHDSIIDISLYGH